MKRKVPLVLTLSMLSALTFSCGSEDPQLIETVDTTTAEVVPDYNLPAKQDNGGMSFTILAADNRNEYFAAEEENGDVVNDAVYARNTAVEEHLGLKIDYVLKDSFWKVLSEYTNFMTSTILSGDDTFSLMTGPFTSIPGLSLEGYFMNVLDLGIDLANPWWVANLEETAAINGKLYSLIGDLSVTSYSAASVVFVNQKIRNDYSLPDCYSMVREGKWTLDAMSESVKNITADLNSDGTFDRETDRIAMIGHLTPFAQMKAASDIQILQRDGDEFVIGSMSERFMDVFDKLSTLVSSNDLLVVEATEFDVLSKSFTEDRNLFFICSLVASEYMREMDSDFGILPLPKYDEEQDEYITALSPSTVLWTVPVTAQNTDLIADFCEVYAHYTQEQVIPAYYDTTLTVKYSRDEDTQEMLQIIRDSLRLTADDYYGSSLSGLWSMLSRLVIDAQAPASFIESQSTAWETAFEKILEAHRMTDN